MFEKISTWFSGLDRHFGHDLEDFIISRDPKNSGDVEQLTQEYLRRHHNFYNGEQRG